ncbi:TPA: hypothetical protein J1W10_004819 [Escherichia coli]|nr:hypothetical protein [Escherichia coli]EGK3476276.1 hypothetical protein [Escherichia coli]MCN7938644.1 hypothetical protein [Escherichia coli]HAZ3508210.1 hypothetical protein [Escherichia coli]HAZ3521954.1 hypothetical protein [Escherichia coli]
MSEQKITGIDLAKTNFYLFSINTHGKPAGKIKLVTNGAIVIHTKRLKSDPGGNLLS